MRVAVFCGSKLGHDPAFAESTTKLGQALTDAGHSIVYGGGQVGLMGVIADAVLAGGQEVIGVIPTQLSHQEVAHTGLTRLEDVSDMHARKARMAELADAFVALPGGAGTLDEIFEAWTWAQLGHHQKPVAFYNVQGYYDPMFEMIQNMQRSGFLWEDHADLLIQDDCPVRLVSRLSAS
ncbi:TIGR00730 family Rossman fold protein [Reinekea blandensis]|uniref:Cytokinin riboside 5'-monophosphate phosphoribohydrolase n=1 Tax=Reinekea blandensis MED297 TaxID=314283 RepID=A4BFX1_9GAMM|nr:TIGR00730 family Rossman fold protein [Reinekea blandensis]EAR08989.1 predicted Rossmann fold nucleotide-binding protein [Reinekea sp. MED297] [Reinekea blandensis MED297]